MLWTRWPDAPDAARAGVVGADTGRLATGDEPILIDEWQRLSVSWDVVRRAVDNDPRPGRFLLTGSASPVAPPTHSGAGRIVRVRMRPLSLAERGLASPTVSLGRVLQGPGSPIQGETSVALAGYAEEIVRSGFPRTRHLDRDFEEMGQRVRRPATLRRWLMAYAAATATTSTIEAIRDAATSNEGDKPTRATVLSYREILGRLWISYPCPGVPLRKTPRARASGTFWAEAAPAVPQWARTNRNVSQQGIRFTGHSTQWGTGSQ